MKPLSPRIPSIIAFLALASHCLGADPELRGQVTDAPSGLGLPEASVKLVPGGGGAEITATTDLFGDYEFPPFPPGSYTLEASYPGYMTFSEARSFVADELAVEEIPLVPIRGPGDPDPTGFTSRIELRIQTFDASAQQPLEFVPYRVFGYTLADPSVKMSLPGETVMGQVVGNTGGSGSIVLQGMPKGHYEFRFNNPDDGSILSFYDEIETTLRGKLKLEGSHSVVANLNPIKSAVTINVAGDDPARPEAGVVGLGDVFVELQAVPPDFVPPGSGDWRDATSAQELLPPMLGSTMPDGAAMFPLLPPLNYIVTATKFGYLPKQILLSPDGTGALPASRDMTLTLDSRTELTVVMESPYLDPDMLEGLFIRLEGIEGTTTQGVELVEPAVTFPPFIGPGATAEVTFVGILPGRYRASVDGKSFSPLRPALEDSEAVVAIAFRGEKYFEVAQAVDNFETFPIMPIPATIRGRLFVAEERESVGLGLSGTLPHPLDRWEGPAYRLAEQMGIVLTESDVALFTHPAFTVVSVNSDKDGTFTASVLPSFWGVKIPSLDGYFGSNFRSRNLTTGETFALGWPYPDDPATGFIPEHPFGSAGLPLSSGDEIELDLFVRKQVYYVKATLIADTDAPTLDLIMAKADPDKDLPFSKLAAKDDGGSLLGSATFDPAGPTGPFVLPIEQGISGDGFSSPKVPNAGAQLTLAALPGANTLTLSHPYYTFTGMPGGMATFSMPDFGAPGDPLPSAVFPMETIDGGIPGLPDPIFLDYKDEHTLLLKFIGKTEPGPGGLPILRFTRDHPVYAYHPSLGTRFFRTGPGFKMAKGDGWQIWFSHIPTGTSTPLWFHSTFDLGAGAAAVKEIEIKLPEEWEGAGTPTIPEGDVPDGTGFNLTFTAINAGEPKDSSIAGLKATIGGTMFTSPETKGPLTGGYTPDSYDLPFPAGWKVAFPDPASTPPLAYDVSFNTNVLPPAIHVKAKLARGSHVTGRLIVAGFPVPEEIVIPGAEVRIYSRYGLLLDTLTTGPDGVFVTEGGALPRAEVLFVDVKIPGFKHYRMRKSPNADADGTTGNDVHDYLLGDLVIEPLPKPSFLPPGGTGPLTGSFDRAGMFLVGVRKSSDAGVLVDSPEVFMKYTLEAAAPAKYTLAALPAFDTAAGDSGDMVGGPGAEVEDEVVAIWIVDPRSFNGNPTTSSVPEGEPDPVVNFSLPAMTDPAYTAEVREFLRKVSGKLEMTPEGPDVVALRNLFAIRKTDLDVTVVSGKKHFKTKPFGNEIDLASLPPGLFQPYVIAETARGTYAHFQLKFAGSDPAYLNLYGMKLPPWLAFLADTAATVGAIKNLNTKGPLKMGDIFPVDLIELLPSAKGVIGHNDGMDGRPGDDTLFYNYMLDANFAEGAPVPGSSLLGFASGFAGISAKGELMVDVNGSAFAVGGVGDPLKSGAPAITVRGGGAAVVETGDFFSPESYVPRGVPKGLRKTVATPGAVGSLSLKLSGGIDAKSRSKLDVPHAASGKLQTLERVIDLKAVGGVEVKATADVTAFAEKAPYIGPFVALARRGLNLGIFVGAKTAVGAQLKRQITTSYAPPARAYPSGLLDAEGNRYPPRRNALGAEFIPLAPKEKIEDAIFLGFSPKLRAQAGRGGTASAQLSLITSSSAEIPHVGKFDALTLELNKHGDWPPVKRAVGTVTGKFGLTRSSGGTSSTVLDISLGSMKIDVPFNTEESLHVVPYSRTVEEISIASFPATTAWCGAGAHLVDHLYPEADYRFVGGSATDLLVYAGVDSVTDLMSIELSLRGVSGWAAPVTVATAAGVVEVAAHELPGGGWMVVWSEIAPGDMALIAPPSTIKWKSYSADLTTATGSGTVASRPGTVYDLCLTAMPSDTLGLLWLESLRGPGSLVATFNGATFALGAWGSPVEIYGETPVIGWDLAGPGFTGSEPVQIMAYVDTAGLLIGAWDGGPTGLPPAIFDPALVDSEVRVIAGPPDTFTAAYPLAAGGVGLAQKVGSGAWMPLPPVLGGTQVDELALAPVDDGLTTHYCLAWTTGALNTAVGFVYLDPVGLPLTVPEQIGDLANGIYSGLEAQPMPGAHAARLVVRFDSGSDISLRTFETTESGGFTILDSDGDGLDDLTEMAIIDADPDDAVTKPSDVTAAGDFDGDGDSNLAEATAGTDPTDPDSFIGHLVEAEVAPNDTAQEHGGADATIYITRSGDLSTDLTVLFTMSGTAGDGTDYTSPGVSVLIPAGAANFPVSIAAIADVLAEGDETAVLTIDPDPAYTIGAMSSATATIADSPFDAWRFAEFTAAQNATDEVGEFVVFDPDGDTLTSTLEYGFGGDPNVSGISVAPTIGMHEDVSGDRFREFIFRRRVADTEFVYLVEISDGLTAWALPAEGTFEEISVVDNGDGTETVTVRATEPLSDTERTFIRVTLERVSAE